MQLKCSRTHVANTHMNQPVVDVPFYCEVSNLPRTRWTILRCTHGDTRNAFLFIAQEPHTAILLLVMHGVVGSMILKWVLINRV